MLFILVVMCDSGGFILWFDLKQLDYVVLLCRLCGGDGDGGGE